MAISKDGKTELESEFFGEKTVILSKSGFGKSYLTRVIIEEGLKKGHTFIVIDPQDAYLNISGFSYIDARQIKSAKGLGALLALSHKNVVIMVKKLTIEEQNKFLKAFLTEFRRNIIKGIQTIVIDEAHKFAPEGQKTDSRDIVRGMFQENRSDGLGCIAITQRISRLDKTIISQADNLAIGRVTSFRDKEAVKNYIDEPKDLDKIKNLKKGEFYLYGFNLDEPEIKQIRESKTEHSGNTPKNLLNENVNLYNNKINLVVRKDGVKKMDEVNTTNEPLNKLVPSIEGFKDLAMLGMKMSLGGAIGGTVGTLLGARFRSPVPVVSSRTLGSAATTIALYAGYRFIQHDLMKDVAKYATAGSAAFTLGSLAFDVLNAAKVKLPNIATFALATATGASPAVVYNKGESGEEVDVNTAMA